MGWDGVGVFALGGGAGGACGTSGWGFFGGFFVGGGLGLEEGGKGMVLRKRGGVGWGGVGWERMVPGGKVVGWKGEGCWGKVDGEETWLGGKEEEEEEEEEEEGCVCSLDSLVSIRESARVSQHGNSGTSCCGFNFRSCLHLSIMSYLKLRIYKLLCEAEQQRRRLWSRREVEVAQ